MSLRRVVRNIESRFSGDSDNFNLKYELREARVKQFNKPMFFKLLYRRLLKRVWVLFDINSDCDDGLVLLERLITQNSFFFRKNRFVMQEITRLVKQEIVRLFERPESQYVNDDSFKKINEFAILIGMTEVKFKDCFVVGSSRWLKNCVEFATKLSLDDNIAEYLDSKWRKITDSCSFDMSNNYIVSRYYTEATFVFNEIVSGIDPTDTKLWQKEAILNWIMENFSTPSGFHGSTFDQGIKNMQRCQHLFLLEKGVFPDFEIISSPIELQFSETVRFYHESCTFKRDRRLKTGLTSETFYGCLVITTNRIVFVSRLKDFHEERKLKSITVRQELNNGFYIGSTNGGSHYCFTGKFTRLIATKSFDLALKQAQGTIPQESNVGDSEEQNSLPSRHISEDVRQQVYREYGGQCAECNSRLDLHVDHMIPHSKGGSNTIDNLQLLCRSCNLRKSARI